MNKFRGTGVAIITPFKNDTSIDFTALGNLVNHIIDGGIDYIVGLGTTGETATLTNEEKQAVISFLVETINSRTPLVIGMGGNNTQDIVNSIRESDLSGVDGLLSVAPYYNKPSQEGLIKHFTAIANSTSLPVILYNVPGRTSSNISAKTCVYLAKTCKNIIGIKEASGDLKQVMDIAKDKPDGFQIIGGDDLLAIPLISAGGSGLISVIGNAYPRHTSEMIGFALKGDFKSAREIKFRLLDMIDLLFVDGNPSGIKALLNALKLCDNYLRLPLVPVTKETMKQIRETISLI